MVRIAFLHCSLSFRINNNVLGSLWCFLFFIAITQISFDVNNSFLWMLVQGCVAGEGSYILPSFRLSSFWKGQSKKKHTIQHNSMFTVLFTHSVFQFCLGAVNRLLHSYIQTETASQCLDPLEKNTLKMYISPKWVSRFYSFYNMHDNKKPNTKLFIKKSKMYSRKVRQRHEMNFS